VAVDRLGVDAAIIFADLLPILDRWAWIGVHAATARSSATDPCREDVESLRELEDVSPLAFVFETVAKTRRALRRQAGDRFAGAPFTLASYAVEGGAAGTTSTSSR